MMSFKKIEEDICQEKNDDLICPKLSNSEQTPFVHLYRAEIQRLVVYKQRLDTTSQWAINIQLFIWSLYLTNIEDIDIFRILFIILISQFVIMILDINRYLNYVDIKYRCNLMESGMYATMLDENKSLQNWKNLLLHTYVEKDKYLEYRPSKWKVLFIRFRNVYGYIFMINMILFNFFLFF
jgi:uncharacterized membrane protein